MNRKLLLTAIGILGLILLFYFRGCESRSLSSEQTQSTQLNTVVEIPESFPAFYESFHTDSLYQMSHIQWPLREQQDSTAWTQESWDLHRPFDNSSGEFTRDLDNFAGIITETIRHNQGLFVMVRRFSQLNGEWHLIYYTVKSIANEGEESDDLED